MGKHSTAASNVIPFQFETKQVRSLLIDDQPWFVAADVCQALAIRNNRDAIARLDDDERGVATTDTPSGQQEMGIINESGLYSLILTSRKVEAKRFKKWVTAEVLPAIRKQGRYESPASVIVPADEEMIQLNYNRHPLLVYRRGNDFWYRTAHVGALVARQGSNLERSLPPEDVMRVQSGKHEVTMLSHRGMLASLGRLPQEEARQVLDWLKLVIPAAFMPSVDAPKLLRGQCDAFTPEEFFGAGEQVPREMPVDALTCSIARATAVLELVMVQFNGSIEGRSSDDTISNALWGVSGDLELIRKMVVFGWENRSHRAAA